MGRNSIINDANPIWWNLRKLVQIKNTRVWETQDRTGIVQNGESPEECWTWFSQIEDDGKKKYRAEFAMEEFWGQKRKFWNKRRGQESGDKTAWTKNSWRLLAMGSHGQCSRGDNCSFRHDINKHGKMTQPNPSPSSFMQQNERNALRTRKWMQVWGKVLLCTPPGWWTA